MRTMDRTKARDNNRRVSVKARTSVGARTIDRLGLNRGLGTEI